MEVADELPADHPVPPHCPLWAIFLLHVACGASLVAGIWTLPKFLGINLVEHPVETLRLSLIMELPIVLLTYTFVSMNQGTCLSVWKAARRGLLSIPIGAFIAAFGAIIFGAPLSLEHGWRTFYWAQLLSVLTVLPAAIILGGSWSDWQRLFAFTKPRGALEYSVCIPAHGAVIGAWFGAWPMPLDWERPWQEWPVCVTYGMVGGFILGTFLTLAMIILNVRHGRTKQD